MIRASRSGIGLAAAAVALGAWTATAAADEVSSGRVPDWIREASEVAVPASEADVVWVLEHFRVEPLPEGGVRETRRMAARVIRPDGVLTLADWIGTYALEDTVESMAVFTLDPEGTWRVAREDEDDIVDVPAFQSSPGYTAARHRIATTPALRVGSLAAFEFAVVRDIDRGSARWTFGDPDAPTVTSRVELIVPEGWTADAVIERGDALRVERDETRLTVVGDDLEPVPRAPLRPAASRILPAVTLRWSGADGTRGFATWDDVARWMRRHAESVLADSGEATAIAERLAPVGDDDLLPAITRAFDFVSRDVRYVAIQIGMGGYVPYPPSRVVRNRYGDCKDKTFLLRALLERWGLDTYPVLVRTRFQGPWPEDVPSPGAFDHMIAAVALPDGVGTDLWPVVEIPGAGRLLLLDGTSRDGGAWTLPDMDQGAFALLVLPDGARRVDLPLAPPDAGRIRRSLTATMRDDGSLVEAALEETYRGGSAIWKREALTEHSDDQRRRAAAAYLADRFPGARVREHAIEGLDDTSGPLTQRFVLEGGILGKRVGSFLVVEPSRMAYDPLPGALPEPPREWDLVLFEPREEAFELRLGLPPGWIPETLPGPVSRTSDECTVEATWTFESATLIHRRTIGCAVNRVPPERYGAYREFVLGVRGALSEAILFVEE